VLDEFFGAARLREINRAGMWTEFSKLRSDMSGRTKNVCAFLRQHLRCRQSNSAACPGHDGDFPLQSKIHFSSFL
jgi:hypothetical protein